MNIEPTDYRLPPESLIDHCSVGGCGSAATTLTVLRDAELAGSSFDFEVYLCDACAHDLGVQ